MKNRAVIAIQRIDCCGLDRPDRISDKIAAASFRKGTREAGDGAGHLSRYACAP